MVPKINKEIVGQKTLYVDCDETLVMEDLSQFPNHKKLDLLYVNGPITVVPNQKNINLLTLFYKLGYTILVWSQTGSDWARTVCEGLNIDHMVAAYLTKPMFYIDDKPIETWVGPRRWRANE